MPAGLPMEGLPHGGLEAEETEKLTSLSHLGSSSRAEISVIVQFPTGPLLVTWLPNRLVLQFHDPGAPAPRSPSLSVPCGRVEQD